jgi:hypothetical protein
MLSYPALLLSLALVAPPVAPPAPSRSDADAARAAAADARLLRGLNRLKLTREQAEGILSVLEAGERRRETVEKSARPLLEASRAALERALAAAVLEGSPTTGAETPAETAFRRAVRDCESRLAEARAQTRAQLLESLPKLLGSEQVRALLSVGAELALQARVTTGGRSGRGAAGDVLQELELLRQSPPGEYPRRRDMMARRLVGAMNPGQMREYFQQLRAQRQGGAPPSPVASGLQASLLQVAGRLDQLRAMSPAVWQQQRVVAANQLARLRESGSVGRASPEELLALFVDEYLLQPRSFPALKARFPSASPPPDEQM